MESQDLLARTDCSAHLSTQDCCKGTFEPMIVGAGVSQVHFKSETNQKETF